MTTPAVFPSERLPNASKIPHNTSPLLLCPVPSSRPGLCLGNPQDGGHHLTDGQNSIRLLRRALASRCPTVWPSASTRLRDCKSTFRPLYVNRRTKLSGLRLNNAKHTRHRNVLSPAFLVNPPRTAATIAPTAFQIRFLAKPIAHSPS